MGLEKNFSTKLLAWFGKGKRDLPWKQTKDPYRIWISEVILQQTQVKQGTPYYHRFIDTFPNVAALAAANEEAVLACWKGLGYYSRARNLHQAAKYIVNECDGIFPSNYKDLLKLKGVGPYSAAAIASFAFDLPHAVADGNVYRVLTRVFAYPESIDQPKTRKYLNEQANELMDAQRPADFNQAIMDLGAMVCTPKQAKCGICPFTNTCRAKKEGLIDQLPKRDPKRKRKERFFHYLVIQVGDGVLLNRRDDADIWKGLYQFPLIEKQNSEALEAQEILSFIQNEMGMAKIDSLKIAMLKTYKQNLTHQKINCLFYELDISDELDDIWPQNQLVSRKDFDKIAVPKSIDWYLNDKRITLL